jgi:hypothetical protein
MDRDQPILLSKYLPSSAELFLPPPVEGPEEFFRPPPEFLARLTEVASMKVPTPKASLVEFATDNASLEKNGAALERHAFDLDALFAANKGTTLDYGSEFRSLNQLEQILSDHPLFPELTKILTEGMDYQYREELTEEERSSEVAQMMERGNHQLAENRARTSQAPAQQGRDARLLAAHPARDSPTDPRGPCPALWNGRPGETRRTRGPSPQVSTAPRPLLLHVKRERVCELTSRYERVQRDDLRLVPLSDNTLRYLAAMRVPRKAHLCRQVRLQ